VDEEGLHDGDKQGKRWGWSANPCTRMCSMETSKKGEEVNGCRRRAGGRWSESK
jgi:hypothetical protein